MMFLCIQFSIEQWLIFLIFTGWLDVDHIEDSLAKINGTVNSYGTKLDG